MRVLMASLTTRSISTVPAMTATALTSVCPDYCLTAAGGTD
jgi:hypothetical protein